MFTFWGRWAGVGVSVHILGWRWAGVGVNVHILVEVGWCRC